MVIAIIAVLAALLMPALREARLRAFSITCLANVRGGHTVLSTFANDHGGVYPEANEYLPKGSHPGLLHPGPTEARMRSIMGS